LTAGLAYLTLNQATWTSASMAKPRHAVGGFIIAGIAFFGIPFMMTFVFGVGEWVNTVVSGEKSVSGKVCQEGKHASYFGLLMLCLDFDLGARAGQTD